jgi:glycosyltransferase involved in cell wall biosynthesis
LTDGPPDVLPVSAVIATRNRSAVFRRTLESLTAQPAHPAELVVVDGSDNTQTEALCCDLPEGLRTAVVYQKAAKLGAAIQRNQGIAAATQEVVWFHDDDIRFEPDCVPRLWAALHSDPRMGGVNATITNQRYAPPGLITGCMFRAIHGREATYAGRVIGPAINLLPEDRDDLPDVVPIEWLNTTCTMYRREALPDPPFPPVFTGYSLMEDLSLSLVVGRDWKLANARTARIFHDSQPGDHKRSPAGLAAMELVNRHFVMTRLLNKRGLGDYFRLGVWEAFQVANAARGGTLRLAAEMAGKFRGTFRLLAGEGR